MAFKIIQHKMSSLGYESSGMKNNNQYNDYLDNQSETSSQFNYQGK